MFQQKDTDWLNGYKTRPIYMLYTKDTPQTYGHIHAESEDIGIMHKGNLCK